MNELERNFMGTLRAFVQNSTPERPDPAHMERLLELGGIHSTLGILCYVWMSSPGLVEPGLRGQLRLRCMHEIATYTRRVETARRLAEALDKEGIDFLLLKGFVVRGYYPVPELRSFGDVDIIIHKEDRQRSDALMQSLGFRRVEDWEPSYTYVRGGDTIELHSRVIGFDVSDKADFVGYFSNIWQHARPARVVALPHAYELKPEFHFLYLLTHIAKHISRSGAGVRMYLDLAFFIRHFGDSLDWDWVVQELEKLRLTDFANVALAAVERWFGVECPFPLAGVADEVLEDFTEFTLSGGVYGYVGRDHGEMFLKQQNRNEADVSRFRTLLYHAFPPVRILVNKYAWLEKYPWLLPVAWIRRLIDRRGEWGRFASNTRQILSADEKKVLKLKRIYKEIGL